MSAETTPTETKSLQDVYAEKVAETLLRRAADLEAEIARGRERIEKHYSNPTAADVKWVVPIVTEEGINRSAMNDLADIARGILGDEPSLDRCEMLGNWFAHTLSRVIEATARDWNDKERYRAEAIVLQALGVADSYALEAAREAFIEMDDFAREQNEMAEKARAKFVDRQGKLTRARGDKQKAALEAEVQEVAEARRYFESNVTMVIEGSRELRGLVRVVKVPPPHLWG
jgi:hypothetical protein